MSNLENLRRACSYVGRNNCLHCVGGGEWVRAARREEVQRIIDALTDLGLDLAEVDQAVENFGGRRRRYRTKLRYGYIGACIRPETLIEVVEEMLQK